MRPYLAVFSARFRLLLQYRAAAFAGFVTQLFWGFMRVMIFNGFYASAQSAMPMSRSQAVTYIWLSQGFLRLVPWGVDNEIATMIRSGQIAYELVRPVNLFAYWFSRAVAMISAPVLLRSVPMFVLGGLFLGLEPPSSLWAGVAFMASLACAVLVSSAIIVLILTGLFWTVSGEGLQRIIPPLALIFSGMIVPLPLFPEFLQPFIQALPFRAILDIPFGIYMGRFTPTELPGLLLFQLGWAAALSITGILLLRQGLKRVVVQGG